MDGATFSTKLKIKIAAGEIGTITNAKGVAKLWQHYTVF
jgi:hypothetical protein